MVAPRDNLLRGQGLLQQGWSGLVSRWKLYLRIWGASVALGTIALTHSQGRPHQVSDTFYYAAANMVMWIASGKADPKISVRRDGQTYPTRASVISTDPYRIAVAGEMKANATLGGVCGALFGFGLCFVLGWFMRESGSRAGADRIISGSAIVSERRLRQLTSRAANAASLHIATVPIPAAFECCHFALLGTTGSGKTTVLRQMLDAIETRGESALVYDTSGEFIAHYYRPGWDVTMSAPKSVSIMAEVAGDRRLVVAHDKAVKSALAFSERHASATMIRADNKLSRQQTGNLTIASFRHDTSRAQDPQLHTHNVIMNATRDAQGKWRSLEPRALYQLQKSIGAVYRQELAVNIRALGYEVEPSKDSLFEIKGVPTEAIRSFSERAAQVEARLAERGQTRATASAAEKQIAALDTRQAKQAVNRAELVNDWRATATPQALTKRHDWRWWPRLRG